MENQTINQEINIINRKKIIITKVKRIKSMQQNIANIELIDTALSISGSEMHIVKLDNNTGLLEIDGKINSVRYLSRQNPLRKFLSK